MSPSPGVVLAHQRFLAIRRFTALDGLRALSVIAVVWHHTAGVQHTGLLARGTLGVQMFFAISGFLITTLLLRERDRTGAISLRKFFARRALRIFPLYYLVLLVYIVLVPVIGSHARATAFWHHLPSFATYTSNWFVDLAGAGRVTFYFGWSLATEEQFYLFWPALLTLLLAWRRGRPVAALVALAALVTLTVSVNRAVGSDALGWRVAGSLALPILLGAAAAVVLHHRRGFALVGPVLTNPVTAPVVAGVLGVLISIGAPVELIEVAMVLLVAACCARESTWLHRALTLRPLAFVGGISYGIYLTHMLAANLVRHIVGAPYGLVVFLPTLAVVIVGAYLSYRFFEGPILARKKRFDVVAESSAGLPMGGDDRPEHVHHAADQLVS